MSMSATNVAVYGHYGMLTETALLIGDSRNTFLRFTTINISAFCVLRSIPILFHPNSFWLQPLRYVWRSDGSALAGLEFTGSGFIWGIPHKALPPITPRHRATTATPFLRHRSCSSIPAPVSFRRRPDLSLGLGYQELLMGLLNPIVGIYQLPNQLASQLTFLWGLLVFLTICLRIIDGFIEIFTEADLYTTLYLSCAKNVLLYHLPVDSSRPSSSFLACFSLEKQTILSPVFFIRSVSLSNVKWKYLSISIAVLLSCVPVRSGSEDATNFVSTIFRGADLVSASQFKVTNSQAFGSVVNFAPTHSSFALNSLSFYLRGISISSLYVVLSFVGRVCLNSSLSGNCNV